MTCGACGNQDAYKMVQGQGWEFCDACGHLPKIGVADVYWDGKAEHGLPDDPRTGQPRVFGSKGEKAAFLRAHGLKEAGDRMHGGNATMNGRDRHTEDPAKARDAVNRALAHVKQLPKEERQRRIMTLISRFK